MTEERSDTRRRLDSAAFRAWLVAGACVWELVALTTDRLPTITHVVHRLRVQRVGRLGVWLMLGWLIEHLFGEGR